MRPRLLSKALRKLTVSGLLALGILLGAAGSARAQSIAVFLVHFGWGGQTHGFWTTTDYYTNGTGLRMSAKHSSSSLRTGRRI